MRNRGERIRTSDLLNPIQALAKLRHAPSREVALTTKIILADLADYARDTAAGRAVVATLRVGETFLCACASISYRQPVNGWGKWESWSISVPAAEIAWPR